LFENRLSGGIPQNLSKLKNLQGLNLRDNKLSGSVPGELSQISTLNGLYLSNNQLTGFFDENLATLCSQLGDLDTGKHIDTGNGFEVKWSDFCTCGAGNQSIDPLYLNQQSPIKNVYQHKNDIIASDFIVGTNNQQSITFSAINVILDEGFEVKKGSSFVAEYNPCGEE